MRSAWGRERYTSAVARAVGLIHAGDMYQVNLTHALVGTFEGSTRALFADLARASSPALGCYLELPPLPDDRRRAVLSLSPELLLRYDASTRTLTTEPMKGTRVGTSGGLAELRDAEKDKAELAMIVDLMRNDLGRVSDIGSVRVDEPRTLEHHGPTAGGVWQASARVSGRLRDGLTLNDALRAVLPAGSITGAPKVRAMQVIHEMEPTPRGPYCGAIGRIDEHGNAELAVGIRTAVIVGSEIRYSVGAGIVAQSDPELEWAETLAKAGPLRAVGALIEDDA
jgi:para-aminobenzoate synthetase component 1